MRLKVSPPPFIFKMENKISQILNKVENIMNSSEFPCHDHQHVLRVYKVAKHLAKEECADLYVVEPSALMHDLGRLDEFRDSSIDYAQRSVEIAHGILDEVDFPYELCEPIYQAILEHRFSKGIKPSTLESAILQDADRLDALGAIGAMRCFAFGVSLGKLFYDIDDPFASKRELDDKKYSIDHFYQKLFKLPSLMNTEAGKKFAEERVLFMKDFLEQLNYELWGKK